MHVDYAQGCMPMHTCRCRCMGKSVMMSMGNIVSMSVYLYMCWCMYICVDMYMCMNVIVSCVGECVAHWSTAKTIFVNSDKSRSNSRSCTRQGRTHVVVSQNTEQGILNAIKLLLLLISRTFYNN